VQVVDIESRELLSEHALTLGVHLERVEHGAWARQEVGEIRLRRGPVERGLHVNAQAFQNGLRPERAGKRAFEIHAGEPGRPVHHVIAGRLRRFSTRPNDGPSVEVAELDPALPQVIIPDARAGSWRIVRTVGPRERSVELHQHLSHCDS